MTPILQETIQKTMKSRVVILGGGITGLSTCHWIQKFSHEPSLGPRIQIPEVLVLEKSNRFGGWIQTYKSPPWQFEQGPRSIRVSDQGFVTMQLIHDLGLENEIVVADAAARRRYLYIKGKIRKVPTSFMSVATNPMLFMRLLPNLLRDVFLQKQSHSTEEDESVQNFFHRHIGSYFTETFVAPFIVGVYAGNPKKLSAQTCFKTLWKLDREYGSLVRGMLVQRLPHLVANEIEEQSRQLHLHLKNERESQLVFSHLRRIQSRGGIMSFKSGLQTLTDALASRYQSNLRFCSKVVRLVPKKDDNNTNPQIEVTFEKNESGDRQYETIVADYVISCLPSNELALILRSTHSEISDLLNQIPFVSLAVVNLGYSTNVIPPSLKGFGYLVPPHERQEILGVTFDSEIFPEVVGSFERKNSSSITVMIGGDLDNHDRVIDVTNTSEKELLDIALRNIRQHLGIDQTPTHAVVKVCRDAIPQYTVGHLQRLDKIKELLQNQLPRMYLAGNSYNGIGVPDCVASASRAATTVVTELFKDHQTTL